jgi:hypothetical protein
MDLLQLVADVCDLVTKAIKLALAIFEAVDRYKQRNKR